jgi:hypothetical protein
VKKSKMIRNNIVPKKETVAISAFNSLAIPKLKAIVKMKSIRLQTTPMVS